MSPRLLYRTFAIAETVTWTMLIAGLILEYVVDATRLGITIAGPIHGFVFLSFAAVALIVGVNQRWRMPLIVAAVATAVVPYATIPFDRYLEKRSLLDGGWRRERTADPRDDRLPSVLLRTLLGHPVAALLIVALGVAGVFAVLLTLGPPGGR